MIPTQDLPPEYSESDPRAPADAPPPFVEGSQGDIKVDKKSAKELVATKGFAFDHPLYIHTTGVSSSSVVIEPDTNLNNQGTIVVTAELTSPTTGIEDRSEFTVHFNSHDEYDFHVSVNWAFWNMMMVQCRIIVRVPSTVSCVHPGIRVEVTNGRVDMSSLTNVDFGRINLKTSNSSVSMSNIRGGDIRFATSNGEMRLTNVTASEKVNATSSNGKMEVENIRTPSLTAVTSNGSLTLLRVAADKVRGETVNSSINCRDTKANDLDLHTTNSSINTMGVEADSMRVSTKNAKVEGTWKVRSLLEVYTTNSKIDGTIDLVDPLAAARIRLTTTNSKIRANLPARSFRGTVDAKTSNSKVFVEWKSSQVPAPAINYIVDDKSYKRAKIGEVSELQHDFVAKTSNSSIDVKFV
ncbi:hypothetical protein GQ54DRAFT_258139 [Martensiomyces pterosporus]|nr:hypothetical protein GQ54DRAFT_258139 [Martensiomyces pterosporus]